MSLQSAVRPLCRIPARPGRRLRALRFATFLAPNLYAFYAYVARRVGEKLRCSTELAVGTAYGRVGERADLAFLCSLPFVEEERTGRPSVEPLAAPVLRGERYQGAPICFSDVIVKRDSSYRSFADLRGCRWAYNERHSQSGYGVTRHRLLQLGETAGYFGVVIEAGWHEQSIRLVLAGEADASAIDAHVLAVALRDQPKLAEAVRIIDTLGPSPIQPLVASRRVSEALKREVRQVLTELHQDKEAGPHFQQALVERFVPLTAADYAPVRSMLDAALAADFLIIR